VQKRDEERPHLLELLLQLLAGEALVLLHREGEEKNEE
jgi:hypothetical protein